MPATLLANGKQQFLDSTGTPLASGTVTFYVPGTSTFKTTWQDPAQQVANTNPITLDASGEAIIYGQGQYRQVVKDSLGNTIWDQLTADTGLPTGTSVTSLTIGTGAQTLTTQTGLNFIAGQFLSITSTANNANFMVGSVTSYTNSTGVLVMNILTIGGSGTIASWSIALSGPALLESIRCIDRCLPLAEHIPQQPECFIATANVGAAVAAVVA